MKWIAPGVLLAGAMAGLFLYTGITRDAEYHRLVTAGNPALGQDQVFLAIAVFSGAIALKSDAMLAYLKPGKTYHSRGDLAAAFQDLTQASSLAPKATRAFELATARFPLTPATFVELAKLKEREGLSRHPQDRTLRARLWRFE